MDTKKTATMLAFAFVGWALCGASMGIGMATTTLDNALIIHAIAAPIIFAGLSYVYFTRYGYTSPLQTAAAFLGVVIAADIFIVALLINRSFAMFASPLGTWIPFALLSTSTYLTGRYVQSRGAASGVTSVAGEA